MAGTRGQPAKTLALFSAVDGLDSGRQTPAMFTFGLTGDVHGFDPMVLLMMAMVMDAYIGEARLLFKVIPHPIVVIGRLITWLDRKLNREHRRPMDRALRGLLTVVIVAGLAGFVGWVLAWLSLNHDFGWFIESILVMILLAQRELYDRVRNVGVALRDGSLEDARDAVSHIVGRDPRQLDSHGVARAAIESLAENFGDGVAAPVFWYILFGLPGLCIYKAVNTMDSMIGYKTDHYRAFGMVAARLDDVLNLIPARLSGLYIVLASIFVPTAKPGKAMFTMLRDSHKHRSMNAGWPEGAMAGALDLALAGPRRYAQVVVKDDWIGSGTAKATSNDIRRALYVYVVACIINAGVVAAMAVIRYSL